MTRDGDTYFESLQRAMAGMSLKNKMRFIRKLKQSQDRTGTRNGRHKARLESSMKGGPS